MQHRNLAAYVWIVAAVAGLAYLTSQLTSVDVGTMDHPHVISLRP
jgi:hypothetical protein